MQWVPQAVFLQQARATWNEVGLLLLQREMVRCVSLTLQGVAGAVCSPTSTESRLLVATISDALHANVGLKRERRGVRMLVTREPESAAPALPTCTPRGLPSSV